MIDVFTNVSNHMLKGVMLHAQWADIFDFLNLRGFKRQQEYYFLNESAEMRGIQRYAINHCNKLIKNSVISVNEIPASWFDYTRFNVDAATRKSYVKDIFKKWFDWETETKNFYEQQFKILADNGKVSDCNKINHLIKCVDKELKYLTCQILKYNSIDWNMDILLYEQDCLHDEYAKKEKEIHVDIC